MELRIKHLEKLDELYETYPLVKLVKPEMNPEKFRHIQTEARREGYQCIGAFTQDNEMVGMCGYWVRHRFCSMKVLHIDSIIAAENMQGKGIGSVLMEWVTEEARRYECDYVALDTYIERKEAHSFYLKHHFGVHGLHFMRKL
jgi:GNAT superfamily N-acetyltransferase